MASVESRMGGKNKKCGLVYPFAAEIRGSNATSLHPKSFKLCGTESYCGSYEPIERCSNQSTNLRKKKHCHLCKEKQMLPELNSKCVKATLQRGI